MLSVTTVPHKHKLLKIIFLIQFVEHSVLSRSLAFAGAAQPAPWLENRKLECLSELMTWQSVEAAAGKHRINWWI